jgi:hypothetical protein
MGLRRSCKSERPTGGLQPLPGSRPAAIRGSRPEERRSRCRALAPISMNRTLVRERSDSDDHQPACSHCLIPGPCRAGSYGRLPRYLTDRVRDPWESNRHSLSCVAGQEGGRPRAPKRNPRPAVMIHWGTAGCWSIRIQSRLSLRGPLANTKCVDIHFAVDGRKNV